MHLSLLYARLLQIQEAVGDIWVGTSGKSIANLPSGTGLFDNGRCCVFC